MEAYLAAQEEQDRLKEDLLQVPVMLRYRRICCVAVAVFVVLVVLVWSRW